MNPEGTLKKEKVLKHYRNVSFSGQKILINIQSLLLQTIIHAWFFGLHYSSTTEHPPAASTNFSDLEVSNTIHGKT